MEQWAELRREHSVRGVSIKELSRRTGLSPKTVRAALRSSTPPRYQRVAAVLVWLRAIGLSPCRLDRDARRATPGGDLANEPGRSQAKARVVAMQRALADGRECPRPWSTSATRFSRMRHSPVKRCATPALGGCPTPDATAWVPRAARRRAECAAASECWASGRRTPS